MPDSGRLVVPSRVYVYIAPTGTVAPADATVALATAWVNVGHTTPDSLSFSTEPEFEEVPSAQSDFPVRRFQTSEGATVSVDLLEWSRANFLSAYGGGTFTQISVDPAPRQYKFVPPALGARTEKSCILEVIDGTKVYRYIFPRVIQVEGVENSLNKGASSTLPLRLAVLGADATDPWYVLSNDPALAP